MFSVLRYRPKLVVVPLIMFLWGVVMVSMAFVKDFHGLLTYAILFWL